MRASIKNTLVTGTLTSLSLVLGMFFSKDVIPTTVYADIPATTTGYNSVDGMPSPDAACAAASCDSGGGSGCAGSDGACE